MSSFDWNELAFASKKPLQELAATFIAAPRELSTARLTQLVKQYLPLGNIVLGVSKEQYVAGLEGQPQFRMLGAKVVEPLVASITKMKTPYTLTTLSYNQRDLPHILEKIPFKRAVFVNGSWYRAFHLQPTFYTLTKLQLPYELISPFASEAEAKAYAAENEAAAAAPPTKQAYDEAGMLRLAINAAKHSFDSAGYQTGVTLGKRITSSSKKTAYSLLATAYNRVVPYQTYAMHHGASREKNFSPPNDLNHYDTNHAEVELLMKALRDGLDITGSTLFITLLPCPTCARMLTSTTINEFVYTQDHTAGYAIQVLEAVGKTVRRVVL